jgi:hypothetical protein
LSCQLLLLLPRSSGLPHTNGLLLPEVKVPDAAAKKFGATTHADCRYLSLSCQLLLPQAALPAKPSAPEAPLAAGTRNIAAGAMHVRLTSAQHTDERQHSDAQRGRTQWGKERGCKRPVLFGEGVCVCVCMCVYVCVYMCV